MHDHGHLFLIFDSFDEIPAVLDTKECQSALNRDPLSASKIDPPDFVMEVVPVVHRGDPRGFV